MRKAIGAALVLAAAVLGSAVSEGAVLVQYGFGANHLNKKTTPDLTDASVTATSITWPSSAGAANSGAMDPTWDGNGNPPHAPGVGNQLAFGTWNSHGYSNDAYFTFTLNANGQPINLQSLAFDVGINGGVNSSQWFYVNTSVDGGWDLAHAIKSQQVGIGMVGGFLNFNHITLDLSGPQYQNLNNITFRVYYDDKSWSTGAVYDNVTVAGVVPEPATMSVLAIGGLIGLRRRRR